MDRAKARSVQERLRAIFSQNGPELVRVNKKFIIWLCLTLYYLKSEAWRIGMNEAVYVPESIQNSAVLFHKKKFISHKGK